MRTNLGPYFPDSVQQLHAVMVSFDHFGWLNGSDGTVSSLARVSRTLKYGGWR